MESTFSPESPGEFFSLEKDEYAGVVETAVSCRCGRSAVIAATGFGTRTAISYVREAERLGADGSCCFRHTSPKRHKKVCCNISARFAERPGSGSLSITRRIADSRRRPCSSLPTAAPNFVALKDGVGDFEQLLAVRALGRRAAGDHKRDADCGDLRARFKGLGIGAYSSAIFNFLPQFARAFHAAIVGGDDSFVNRAVKEFLAPYLALRKQQGGYAVSIVKAGVDIVGKSAGPVRPPLSPLTDAECAKLRTLISIGGGLAPAN